MPTSPFCLKQYSEFYPGPTHYCSSESCSRVTRFHYGSEYGCKKYSGNPKKESPGYVKLAKDLNEESSGNGKRNTSARFCVSH